MDKMYGYVEEKKTKKKRKDVIDAVPVMVPIMMQFQVLY